MVILDLNGPRNRLVAVSDTKNASSWDYEHNFGYINVNFDFKRVILGLDGTRY